MILLVGCGSIDVLTNQVLVSYVCVSGDVLVQWEKSYSNVFNKGNHK